MQELKVKQVIIGKQFECSKNLQELLKIAQKERIPINIVEAGNRINIEKDLYLDILWPTKEQIPENPLNNNSIVCKLNYNNFSMLFTADIEKIAEEKIISVYSKTNILNSTVLKVAHHGSKSSSIKEFLEAVKPKIALIGVGKSNIFGHPNEEVVKRIKNMNCKVLRTDEMGEVTIRVCKKGRIKVKHRINNETLGNNNKNIVKRGN